MQRAEDQKYMHRALELAALALGRTSPNPVVGAVVVKDHTVIGEGYHKQAGTPHAEVHALQEAGMGAAGATLYVTLEPCSHYGRTPPCADAVIAAGISRVVIATTDPNPQVAGQGINRLSQAGIVVEVGVMETEARRLNEIFFKYIQTGSPFVAVKTAMTLDGKIASASGDSRWVTGEEARHRVHELRDLYDAIMVGIGTVLKDDPQLNTRLPGKQGRDPVRIIIDTNLDLPAASKIARSAGKQRTLVFCSPLVDPERKHRLESLGLEIITVDCREGLVLLPQVMEKIGKIGLCSLLVEGGGEINGSLLVNDLIDKVYWFIAPKLIGGKMAPTPIGGPGAELMSEARSLKNVELECLGEDFLITGYFEEWC